MQRLYFMLAGLHMLAIVVTGSLWTTIILKPASPLKTYFRDIRAVHFGSLYLVPMFLGLAYAYDALRVPAWHQAFFPAGLGLLVTLSSIGYLFPVPPGLDPWYYWTVGWGKFFSLVGLACLAFCMVWTGIVLGYYSLLPA